MNRRTFSGGAAALTFLTACGSTSRPSAGTGADNALEKNLVLYSARKEEFFQPVVNLFQQKTGVNVTVKSGATGELTQLIEQERSSPRGDVFFTTDAGDAETLRTRSLLEPYISPNAGKIPAEFKAADGSWTGVIGRSRNILVNTDRVKPGSAPASVLELVDPKWKDQVAVASIREGGVRLWLASLLVARGEEFTTRYVRDLKANGLRVLANHTEVTNAVARGELPLGLVNHYYYVRKRAEGATSLHLVYPDQGPTDTGTVVTPISVAIVKGARHPNAARAFVDFILTPDGQLPMARQGQEFPLTPGAPLGDAGVPGVRSIDQVKRPAAPFIKIAEMQGRAVELFTPQFSA